MKLVEAKTPVRQIYEKWIIPSILTWECAFEAQPFCIWKEHILTTTMKTAIELCYPLVMAEYEKQGSNGKKVFVFCPWEEFHELGAKIIADLFRTKGFEVTYTGTNTPEKALMEAIRNTPPDYLAISITNPYHLFQVQDLVRRVRIIEPTIKIIAGGQAIQRNQAATDAIAADCYLYSMQDFYCFAEKKGGV